MGYHCGQLLVATPKLLDPNFARTVILLLDHDVEGALGVVINRPSELPLRAVLPPWAEAATEPQMLFSGGPVSPESALGVGLCIGAGPADGFKRLMGDYGLVDLDAEPGDLLPDLVGVRVFSGYAGWGGEQLEAEIGEGSWYVVNAVATDLLNPEPDRLWRSVLRRQPGELAYVANFPDDPTMN
ncbi:MAG: YqgE/AlgH family protein [Propionibacteriales bacterium]|nr:YqgE/AlgH family protein [Propionibacteriales bacterium]